MKEKALQLLVELDQIYFDVINGNRNIRDRLDKVLIKILEFNEEDISDEIIGLVILIFNQKVNLIYKLCSFTNDSITLEELEKEFELLEIKQFEINNSYIMGTVDMEIINEFKRKLFSFRNQLYSIPINDDNIIKIAKMKSKIQHYETEILEDEDILSVAYQNSN